MKIVACVFVVIGVILLIIAGLGKLLGNPHLVLGTEPKSIVALANSALLLGLSANIFTKK
jgi:hypothetical protein